jgi:hypothetical protein
VLCQNCSYNLNLQDGEAKYCSRCGFKLFSFSKEVKKARLLDLRTGTPAKVPKQHPYNPAQQLHSTRQRTIENNLQNGIQPSYSQKQRQERALKTPKSHNVTKFGSIYHESPALQSIDLNQHQKQEPSPKPMAPHKSYELSKSTKRSQAIAASMAQHHTRYIPPPEQTLKRSTKITRQPFFSRLNQAIRKNTLALKPPKRFTQVATAGGAALLLIGYVTYLNLPNITFRVAASRAGIDAALPSYTPQDYTLDGKAVAYKPGLVSVVFRSEKLGTTLTLIQSQTQLDSNSLYEQFVVPQDESPTTVYRNGLVIYFYKDTYATWVNAGTQYTIEGNGLLEQEQILKIASSL